MYMDFCEKYPTFVCHVSIIMRTWPIKLRYDRGRSSNEQKQRETFMAIIWFLLRLKSCLGTRGASLYLHVKHQSKHFHLNNDNEKKT